MHKDVFFYKMKNRALMSARELAESDGVHLQGNIPVLVESDISKANLVKKCS